MESEIYYLMIYSSEEFNEIKILRSRSTPGEWVKEVRQENTQN